jgi:hypothetical protein
VLPGETRPEAAFHPNQLHDSVEARGTASVRGPGQVV